MQLLSCQCDAILGCGGKISPQNLGKGDCWASQLFFSFIKDSKTKDSY